jgi:hypothetical protein
MVAVTNRIKELAAYTIKKASPGACDKHQGQVLEEFVILSITQKGKLVT